MKWKEIPLQHTPFTYLFEAENGIRVKVETHSFSPYFGRKEATAILSLLNGDNAPEAKETAKELKLQAWDAATEISKFVYHRVTNPDYGVDTIGTTDLHGIILKHIKEQDEANATIAMLAQQLADKKEIIRRLTT